MATITAERSGRRRFPRWEHLPGAGWGRAGRTSAPPQGYWLRRAVTGPPRRPCEARAVGRGTARPRTAGRRLLPDAPSPARAARARRAPGAAFGSTMSCTRPACCPVACSMRTSSMLTPAVPGVGEDPGQLARLVADEDRDDLVRARGGAVLAGDPDPARVAAAQHVLDAGGAARGARPRRRTAGRAGPDRLVEVGGDVGEHVGDRAGVRGEDVDPHPGSEAAIRVTSRMPCPHSRTAASSACSSRAATMLETSCGHVRDEGDGPVVGVRVHHDRDGTARATTSSRARLSTSVSVSRVGVSTQGRPSKRSAVAASGPDCSRPDIGCVPM